MFAQNVPYQPPGAKAAVERYLNKREPKPNVFQNMRERFTRRKLFSNKWLTIVVGVVVIIVILVVAFLLFGNSNPGTTYYPATQATQQVTQPISSSTPASAPWNQAVTNIGKFFNAGTINFVIRNAPKNFTDMASNWLGWLILIWLICLLITNFRDETTDRNEPKDFLSVKRGLIICLVTFYLADAIALKTIQACQFFGQGCSSAGGILFWITTIFRAMGLTFLVAIGFGAAVGGNWDASPISVSVFLAGILIKLAWPAASPIGNIAIFVAILVHIYEIARHKDDRSSAILAGLFTVVASVIVGGLVFYGARSIAFLNPYRLVLGYITIVIVALGTSSTVQHRVGAILPGTLRENLKDVPGNIYFDMKLIVLMAAITYLII